MARTSLFGKTCLHTHVLDCWLGCLPLTCPVEKAQPNFPSPSLSHFWETENISCMSGRMGGWVGLLLPFWPWACSTCAFFFCLSFLSHLHACEAGCQTVCGICSVCVCDMLFFLHTTTNSGLFERRDRPTLPPPHQ